MATSTKGKNLSLPYIVFQVLFNCAYCGIAGYASAFLINAGFSNLEIGTVTSVSTIIGLVIQPFIGDLVDNSKAITEKRINIFMYALTALCAAILMAISVKPVVGVLYVVMTCALTVEIALGVALAFAHIQRGASINFSLARGFGSIGYSLASFLLGQAAAMWSADVVIPITIGVCIVAIILVAVAFPEINPADVVEDAAAGNEAAPKDSKNIAQFAKENPRFILYTISVILVFFPHMIHATYWFQFITNIGGNVDEFGTMSSICALLEFPAMAAAPWLMKKLGLRRCMIISAIFFPVKILFIGLAPNLGIMYIGATIMQMGSFALFTPVSSYYAGAVTSVEDNNKAQTILNVGRTAATVVAALIGGFMLDMGGYVALTIAAAVIGAVGVLMMVVTSPKVPAGMEYADQEAAKAAAAA